MPAKLRMNVSALPGIEKDNCKVFACSQRDEPLCIDTLEAVLKKAGGTAGTIWDSVRIAAVMATAHRTLG